ncbi:MAG: response regulator [Candidatus Binataceae bacterium]|nr:response regulator [Candidatus Binataceae bacterium]
MVEDESDSREFLIQILEIEGFRALGFSNGADALDYLHQSPPPCLIVLDILMPVMDGRQFCAALMGDPGLATIPVVVVTALEPSSIRQLAAVQVFKKPVNVDALLGVVRSNC